LIITKSKGTEIFTKLTAIGVEKTRDVRSYALSAGETEAFISLTVALQADSSGLSPLAVTWSDQAQFFRKKPSWLFDA
jgi:hypothetical protein